MRKLLVYMKTYVKECILAPLFKLLEASLDLIVPLVIAAVIDNGINAGTPGGDKGYILRMCLLLIGLGLVGLAFSITAQFFSAKAAVGFVTKLRHALFSHLQFLSYVEKDKLGTSTMITRMTSDMNQVQSGVNLTLRLLLRSPFIVFGAMIMAFTIDTKAALVFVVAIPLLSLVVFGIMLWCIPQYKKVQQKLDKVLGITRENLTGVRVLRAFTKEEEEKKEFESRNEQLTAMQKFVGRISALMNPVTYVIINLAIIALIWVGAIRVDAGVITQGAVIALYNYMSQILVELVKLANLIISITKSIACGNRIEAVFELTPSLTDGKKEPGERDCPVAVTFVNAGITYQDAGNSSLSGLNLTVPRGQTIGVIGGTGSGKSTLVNLIPRFYDVTEGEVLVDGVNVKDYPLDALRQKIGMVPQNAMLFKGSIRDNLRWGKEDATDDELMAALAAAQGLDVVQSKEGGLDYQLEQGGRNLSGGQKQRLTIARALVRSPEILILDDSASALDFATDAALRKALRELPGKPTVFVVSQRTSSIHQADQIVVLDEGRVAGIGKHEELLASCDVYKEIYDSQFKKEATANG